MNASERFVRRLVAERRIAFHRVGRHVRFAVPAGIVAPPVPLDRLAAREGPISGICHCGAGARQLAVTLLPVNLGRSLIRAKAVTAMPADLV
ncbi:excisionase family DNA-binding protein [Pseudonocardia autotrophica]|uniref:excisionase family DNA-binding protein n=1 Tax=Pseudonocardia autotrophica TaxID=2074 RepID=UPI001E3FA051|nr:excisionase family DNA-binding protein [Pseudonocardia autotrophica]